MAEEEDEEGRCCFARLSQSATLVLSPELRRRDVVAVVVVAIVVVVCVYKVL